MSTPPRPACWRWRCWCPCAAGWCGRGIVLAAATLTKFLPAVVLPAFWRPPDWRLPAAFAATAGGALPALCRRSAGRCSASCRLCRRGRLRQRARHLSAATARQRRDAARLGAAAYIVLALGVLGLLGARFAFGGRLPAAPGARLTLAGAPGGDPWRRRAGRGVAALPVVFRLARAAGLPGAAAQRAVDARRRAAAGAWLVRVSGGPWRGLRTRRGPRRVRSAPRPDALPRRSPPQAVRSA